MITGMCRTARRSTLRAARGGWADDVTGRLGWTVPTRRLFQNFCQRGLEDRWRSSLCSFWSRILSDGGHGVDIASVIPKSDAMRRPGYTISKYGTGMWFTHVSICRCQGTKGLLYMWRHGP